MVQIIVNGLKETQSLVANIIRNSKTEPIKMIRDMSFIVRDKATEIAKQGKYSKGRGAGYKATKLSDATYIVEPTAKDRKGQVYGGYLEYGTGPHRIPKNGQSKMYWRNPDGTRGHALIVNHPGARGRFPLRKATQQVQNEFPNIYRKYNLIKRGTT